MTSDNSFIQISVVELIALCIDNNTIAWEKFVKHFGKHVEFCAFREKYRAGVSSYEVKEIVQETFLSLLSNDYRTLRDFRGSTEVELNAYLAKVVHNISVNLSRKEDRQNFSGKLVSLDNIPNSGNINDYFDEENAISFEELMAAEDKFSPDYILKDKFSPQEVQDLLRSVLEGSNAARDALIFYLHVIVGLSAREIATMPAISLTITNIQTIVSRTRERLREVLNKEAFRNL
ncbi:MAG: RNA polymerase sigma factor [Acidobacteria bacterium]|nr:RNA polymerase sigma factor [Acidobacteriota bacterium]